jgi:hypothetical protein
MARFREGDLGQRKASQISAHLAGCDRCSALSDDLGGVSTLLARAGPPPRMPDGLTARITSALAAEAAGRAAVPAGNGAAGERNGLADRRRSRRPRLPRMSSRAALRGLAAAAAVVLVAAGGYEIAVRSGGSPPSGTAASGRAARPATRAPGDGVMAPALPAAGPALRYQHAGRQASVTPITTDTDFTPAKLTSQVTAEVTRYGAGFSRTGPNVTLPGQSGRTPAAVPTEHSATFGNLKVSVLRACVNRIAAGQLVVLVDVARYNGTPGTVIVTEGAATGPMGIWVVGAGCSASRSDVLAHTTAAAP